MAKEKDSRDGEVRPVPPGREDPSVAKGMKQAGEQGGKDAQARVAKELKALERVHAKHAKQVEKVAARTGVDARALGAELEQLQGQQVESVEQARALRQRTAEVARKHRSAHVDALREAGIEPDELADEILATVAVPEHARALGRRRGAGGGRGGGGMATSAGSAQDPEASLGWTTEVDG